MPEDVEVIIGDGIEEAKKMIHQGSVKFDYIFIDVNETNDNFFIRYPAMKFCVRDNLRLWRELVTEMGVVVLYLMAKSTKGLDRIESLIQEGWKTTHISPLSELEKVMAMTNRENGLVETSV